MPLKNKDFTCWVITEGMAGTENQCLGVAEALNIQPVIRKVQLSQPWKMLTPALGFEQSWTFIPRLESPWPDLLLTSGRKSVAAARYIKKQSKGRTFSVHIQDPKTNPKDFDLVAVPEHDSLRSDNVIVTSGAPNRITAEKLAQAREEFSGFQDMPGPRIAVLIGGNSKAYTLTPDIMHSLCDDLKKLNGGLMITASRRTGEENQAILHDALQGTHAYIWDGHGDNPYMGMLAWADTILVTADSVSMLSDACTTGKPAYIIPLTAKAKSSRIEVFHQNLIKSGAARTFEGHIESWQYKPLSDAEFIATEITRRIKAKG